MIEFKDLYGDKVIMPKRTRYYFGAVASAYRLQLVAQSDMKDERTGGIIKGRNKAAQFKEGVYPVRTIDEAKMIYATESFREGLIWDMDTRAALEREQNYQSLKETVLGNEEDRRRLFEELKSEMLGATATE